jgi:hypothetical protein
LIIVTFIALLSCYLCYRLFKLLFKTKPSVWNSQQKNMFNHLDCRFGFNRVLVVPWHCPREELSSGSPLGSPSYKGDLPWFDDSRDFHVHQSGHCSSITNSTLEKTKEECRLIDQQNSECEEQLECLIYLNWWR